MKNKITENTYACKKCRDDHYLMVGCCSGRECGCMGQPVDADPCPDCNQDESKLPSQDLKENFPFFFMTKEEIEQLRKQREDKECL
jgi:hypothetical protein